MGNLVLENKSLRVEFDSKTGSLQRLLSRETGWEITRRPELAANFSMLVPLPQRRNNPVRGERQHLSESKVSADGKSITLVWKNLISDQGGVLDIVFTGTVTLSEQGLHFNATVDNHSPHVVESVSWPYIGDVSKPAGSETLARLSSTYAGMQTNRLMPFFNGDLGYFGFDCPNTKIDFPFTPFVLLDAAGQGLYVGVHETTARQMVTFYSELRPGVETGTWGSGVVPKTDDIGGVPNRLEFTCWHFPYANPGETSQLASIFLSPYVGTWHRGVDVYKQWRKTWFRHFGAPAWAADVHSWQQIHINSPEDELRCRYTDLVKYGEDCARHGVKAIQLVGWNHGGQDRGNPMHDADPRLGTPQELRDAIRKIQALGVKMILFSKFTWTDRSQPFFKEEYVNYACTDPYGDYYMHPGYRYQTPSQLSDINTRRLVPLCQSCAPWRRIADRELGKVIDLGADGMLYDECQHHSPAKYCFHPGHGHHVPAYVYGGDAMLCDGFRKITENHAPEFLYGGEACYDLQYSDYHVSYFRIGNPDHTALQRYIDPWMGIMVAVTGFNDRNMLNQCLMYRYIISYEPYNFKGRLDDYPLTIEYGKKIDALRRRWRELLWDGEYRDTQEACVVTPDGPYRKFSVFRAADGRRAVVVMNPDATKEISCTISIDGGRCGRVVIPEDPDGRECDGQVVIPPNGVAVVMEGRNLR